jgi:hypothetical protein
MQPLTRAAISASVSGVSTTKGYSTRQSVASVTWLTRERPSNLMLSLACQAAQRLANLAAQLRGLLERGVELHHGAACGHHQLAHQGSRSASSAGVRRFSPRPGGGSAHRPAACGGRGCPAGRPANRGCAAPPRCRPAPHTACGPSGRCDALCAAGPAGPRRRNPAGGSRSPGRRTRCSCTEFHADGQANEAQDAQRYVYRQRRATKWPGLSPAFPEGWALRLALAALQTLPRLEPCQQSVPCDH